MNNTLKITCRDTDDSEYWLARLNAADQDECDILIDSMLGLSIRLNRKGISANFLSKRIDEGMDLYLDRFGVPYIPF